MDRRERYDPEDIEILMRERSFDELLEEERAYVLRHVSDRAEYQAMRGLLLQMHKAPQHHERLEADPAIRGRVLQVFRDQQQPQWRIWLNSVGAWLVPENAFAVWRPALAFASLAVVIGLAVLLLQQTSPTGSHLAEVRQDRTRPQAPERKGSDEDQEELRESASENALVSDAEVVESALEEPTLQVVKDSEQPKSAAADRSYGLVRDDIALDDEMSENDQQEERMTSYSLSESVPSSHIVSAEELSRNMSVANVTGKVQVRESRSPSAERSKASQPAGSMADHSALYDLLATGW